MTHNDRGYGHLAVCGSIRCRTTMKLMREMNLLIALQPANAHRRVLPAGRWFVKTCFSLVFRCHSSFMLCRSCQEVTRSSLFPFRSWLFLFRSSLYVNRSSLYLNSSSLFLTFSWLFVNRSC